MADLPDYDNASKWWTTFRSLPPLWKTICSLMLSALIAGGIISCNQTGQIKSLQGQLDKTRDERDVANQKIDQLNADYSPLRTAALLNYGKADPETLRKLAADLSTLRSAWSNAEEEAKQLRSEVQRVRAQTERAVDSAKEQELLTILRTLPKVKVGLKRYEHTAEAIRFSTQLERVFKDSGFDLTVYPPEAPGINLSHLVGQLFQLNLTNQPPNVKRIFDALNATGMNFTVVDQPGMSSSEIELAIFRLSK